MGAKKANRREEAGRRAEPGPDAGNKSSKQPGRTRGKFADDVATEGALRAFGANLATGAAPLVLTATAALVTAGAVGTALLVGAAMGQKAHGTTPGDKGYRPDGSVSEFQFKHAGEFAAGTGRELGKMWGLYKDFINFTVVQGFREK